MKRSLFILSLLIFSLSFYSCGGKPMGSPLGQGTEGLTISVQGEASSTPDQIDLSFSLGSLQTTSAEAISSLESMHHIVISALETQGIPVDDLKMTSYNLTTETSWDSNSNKQVIIGFRANKSFILSLVYDEDKVQNIYSTLLAIPSDEKTFFSFNVAFNLKNPEALLEEALGNAILKATEEAKFISKSLGIKLKRIINITPDQMLARNFSTGAMLKASPVMMDAEGFVQNTAPVSIQDIKVTRNISITWDI